MRYLRLVAGMVCGRFPTLDALYQHEIASWKRLGFRSSLDWVDTWNEPGYIQRKDGVSVWVPNERPPTCDRCDDTHRMSLGDRDVPCTHCPLPCDRCAKGPRGIYCAETPCECGCHEARRRN